MSVNASQARPGAAACEDLPIIDMEVIEELRSVGSNGELLQRVLSLFGQHVPVSLGKIRALAISGSHDELADSVHALKSMCGNIGARRATALCEETERMLRQHFPFDKQAGIERLLQEAQVALEAVEQLRTA
jgi:HPt (histidine-containing phosphotransfer) domain-containing protein